MLGRDAANTGLLEAAPDAIVGIDAAGIIVLVNAQTERLFGYPRDELLGRPLELLVPESARRVHPGHRETYVEKPSPRPMGAGMELAGRRRDGSEFPAEISLSTIEVGDDRIFAAAVRDVTERKRAEAKFQSLLEAAPDAIVGVDADGAIVLVNAQTERIFGYPREELLGQPIEMLIPQSTRHRHPAHRRAYIGDPHPRPMGAGMELAGRRRDGSEFPAEISLSAIETESGVVVSAAVRDVSDRKAIEQQLREKNIELERVARAKDTFLASMSHELRTPLNAIIGFTGTLLMELPGALNEDQARHLRTVEQSGKHLLAIINDILDLAKIESGAVQLSLEKVDCGEVVYTVVSSLRPLAAAKGLELTVDVPVAPIVVESDSRVLGQILINLAGNAIKFTEAGEVRVALARDLNDHGAPMVAISDTGPGISSAEIDHLFSAFERGSVATKRGVEGTGLGLHVSGRLAELIGSTITVDSTVGMGSTFTLVMSEV
jgi:PAS domain S-box-containing protein